MESVVPGLELTARVLQPVWLEDDESQLDDPTIASTLSGEWVNALGFEMRYRGVWYGAFERGSSGSTRERVLDVARELMSQVQDIVALTTKEPWPMIVAANGRNMALADATIEGDDLHMWYGDRGAPALKLPSVHIA
jgi:hypothetical protein